MQAYYNEWKFKHPYPEDFKKSIEQTSGQNLDELFFLLNKKGELKCYSGDKNCQIANYFKKTVYFGIENFTGLCSCLHIFALMSPVSASVMYFL